VGKLLHLMKAGIAAQRQPQRRVQGVAVAIEIVGESFHQDAIRQLSRRVRDKEFDIVLRAEPENPYDKNAVAVLVDGALVGHMSKPMAKDWQPMVLAAQAEGFAVVGRASIFGGTRDKPSLGVFGSAPWPGANPPPDKYHQPTRG
jgi:hypothetical protein